MKDKDIIKALECCSIEINCRNCPIHMENSAKCVCTLLRNAHDLITRQKTENENLKVELQSMRGAANSLKMHYEEAQAEIENLKNENFILSQKRANIFEITDAYGRGRSKAVKDFAERIKMSIKANVVETLCNDVKGVYNAEYVLDDIDILLKEMVGENND